MLRLPLNPNKADQSFRETVERLTQGGSSREQNIAYWMLTSYDDGVEVRKEINVNVYVTHSLLLA